MATQGQDGQAHLTYFDRRSQASFVWDGEADAIHVSIGGYGEPVDHEIPAPEELGLPQWSAIGVTGRFEDICQMHAATLEDYA